MPLRTQLVSDVGICLCGSKGALFCALLLGGSVTCAQSSVSPSCHSALLKCWLASKNATNLSSTAAASATLGLLINKGLGYTGTVVFQIYVANVCCSSRWQSNNDCKLQENHDILGLSCEHYISVEGKCAPFEAISRVGSTSHTKFTDSFKAQCPLHIHDKVLCLMQRRSCTTYGG